MALNFPSSPTTGQIFTSSGTTYVFDGTVWNGSIVETALPFNYVVNPSFQISQQNGNTAQTASGAYPADKWWFGYGGVVVPTVQRVQVITPYGSPNRIRSTITTPDPTLTTTDHHHIMQRVEGARMAPFCWNQTAAYSKPMVIRFGWKSPAGTYSFNIRNLTDAAYITTFTISAAQANTDTIQVLAIPPPNVGAWLIDTGVGCQFSFGIAFGPTYYGVLGWQTGAATAAYGLSTNTNGIATAGLVYEVFDVGMYLDPYNTGRAPPWEYIPDRAALVDCQREWQKCLGAVGIGIATTASPNRAAYPNQAVMRANPTPTLVGVGRGWDQATAPNITAIGVDYSNTYYFEYTFTVATAQTAGRAAVYLDGNGTTIYIAQSARL